ncbi:MAG TPA: PepSY domain-containing protein [Caulobacteraceae bacterium]|nr:PepSY domain-containing protein [Caulobacteraceae bacterium]
MTRTWTALIGGLAAAAVATASVAQDHEHHGGAFGGGGHGGGFPATARGGFGGGPRYGGGGGGYAAPSPYGYAPPAPTRGYPARGYPSRGYPGAAYGPRGYAAPYGGPPGYIVGGKRPNSLAEGWSLQQEEARSAVRHGQMAPLGRVIEGIERRTPGRQLDTGIEYQGGRPIYRVRWMTQHGRRVDILVDAATGAILSER